MIYSDKRSFAKGELSPDAAARSDLAAYDAGAARLENFIVQITGGITRSPGTRFVAEAKYTGKASILVPFTFSTLQSYVIEIGDEYARFYMNRGRLETGGTPYEIETPWAHNELRRLSWVQEADVVYFFHPDHRPRKLARLGHTNWALSILDPEDGPFLDENADEDASVTASAVTGTGITLTANTDLWEAGNVGSIFRIAEQDPNSVQPWEADTNYTLSPPDQVRYDGKVYQISDKLGNSGTVPPTHDYGKAWDGRETADVRWEYLHSGFGTVRITGFTDARTVTVDVIKRLPDSVADTGSWRWAEAAWSNRRGYPAVATFADQRLVAAASRSQPMTFWGSRAAGNYERFEEGVEADAAYRYTLASRQVNSIQWLINAPLLVLGAPDVVWTATGESFEAPVTPKGVRARPATEEGTALVLPEVVGTAVLFVSRTQRRLYELTYDGSQAGYATRDLTLLARHVTKGD